MAGHLWNQGLLPDIRDLPIVELKMSNYRRIAHNVSNVTRVKLPHSVAFGRRADSTTSVGAPRGPIPRLHGVFSDGVCCLKNLRMDLARPGPA